MANFDTMTIEELEEQLTELAQQQAAIREVKLACHAALEQKVIAEREAARVEGFRDLSPGVRDAVVQAIAAQADAG